MWLTQPDPIDVYYLSKKFTSTPIITPHIRGGFNTSLPRIIHELTVSGTEIETRNVLKIGVQAGVGFDFNLTNNISLCAEGNYANKGFKRNTEKGNENTLVLIIFLPWSVKIGSMFRFI